LASAVFPALAAAIAWGNISFVSAMIISLHCRLAIQLFDTTPKNPTGTYHKHYDSDLMFIYFARFFDFAPEGK